AEHQAERAARAPRPVPRGVPGKAAPQPMNPLFPAPRVPTAKETKEAIAELSKRLVGEWHATGPEPARAVEYRADGTFRDGPLEGDRKSTRLNSSHLGISYAVFCLKKK